MKKFILVWTPKDKYYVMVLGDDQVYMYCEPLSMYDSGDLPAMIAYVERLNARFE